MRVLRLHQCVARGTRRGQVRRTTRRLRLGRPPSARRSLARLAQLIRLIRLARLTRRAHLVLDVTLVRSFLDWLGKERACGPRTRNQRLAAPKTFARSLRCFGRSRTPRALPADSRAGPGALRSPRGPATSRTQRSSSSCKPPILTRVAAIVRCSCGPIFEHGNFVRAPGRRRPGKPTSPAMSRAKGRALVVVRAQEAAYMAKGGSRCTQLLCRWGKPCMWHPSLVELQTRPQFAALEGR